VVSADADAAHELADQLCGRPEAAAVRWVQVLHAQAAALAWVRQAGAYPTPGHVAARLSEAAAALADPADERDPRTVLIQVAAQALAGQDRGAA
jgi:hypothetical protein